MAKKKAAKKPAPKASTKKPAQKKAPRRKIVSKKAVRYSPEKKAEIIAFVRDHDKAHGRGGQTAASKKFAVSTISIWNWMKAGAKPAPKKKAVAKKAATKATNKKAAKKKAVSKQGVRYSPEQKAEVVQFVRDHDKVHGCGGQTAAAKKFGKSVMTISTWLKGSAKTAPKKTAVAKKTAPPENEKPAMKGGTAGTLRRMMVIQEDLEGLRAEFERLKLIL